MKISRSVSMLVIMIFMVPLLAACAPQTKAEPLTIEKTVIVEKEVLVEVTPVPKEKPEGAKTVIRVGSGDSGEGLNPHQEIIARFEAENPDILVQLEAVAGFDYYARLLTQIAAEDAPDIMQIGDDAVPMFVGKGGFLPLDPFISGPDGLDTGIYLPNTLKPGMYEGSQYFLPKDFSTMGVYYNKKIFDTYEVPYPEDGWTWEDFLQTAQQLTIDEDKDGNPEIWGVQLMANWNGFEYFTASTGARLISEDGKEIVGYMDSAETVKAVQFYADLYHKYKVAPLPADFNQWAGGNPEFANGKAAMRLFGRWPQSGLLTNPEVDLGVVTVPVGDVKANILFWGGFGIYSGSKNPEAAWRFLKYYVGEGGSEVWIKHGIPPVASVIENAGMDKDPIEGAWIAGLGDVADRAYIYSEYWGETGGQALSDALQMVIIDENADVSAVMKEAAQKAQTLLDEKTGE